MKDLEGQCLCWGGDGLLSAAGKNFTVRNKLPSWW